MRRKRHTSVAGGVQWNGEGTRNSRRETAVDECRKMTDSVLYQGTRPSSRYVVEPVSATRIANCCGCFECDFAVLLVLVSFVFSLTLSETSLVCVDGWRGCSWFVLSGTWYCICCIFGFCPSHLRKGTTATPSPLSTKYIRKPRLTKAGRRRQTG